MKAMKKSLIISLFLGILMVLSGVLTKLMTPNISSGPKVDINLETLIPTEFEDWKLDLSIASPIVTPGLKDLLEKTYSQTLSRTYVNKKGERIMLSIAYGGAEKADLNNHRPEICYASSGFDISKMTKTFVDTTFGRIPVMHLVAKQGTRNEPITYWTRIGDSLTRGWIEQKLSVLGYGLAGKAPDGLLVRVSSISNDEQDSYRIQQVFLAALLKAVRSEERHWLVGRMNS
jgi:EpsI family protein